MTEQYTLVFTSNNIEGRSNNNSYHEQYEEQGRMVSRAAVTNAGNQLSNQSQNIEGRSNNYSYMNKMRRKLSV